MVAGWYSQSRMHFVTRTVAAVPLEPILDAWQAYGKPVVVHGSDGEWFAALDAFAMLLQFDLVAGSRSLMYGRRAASRLLLQHGLHHSTLDAFAMQQQFGLVTR
jgi:hypothetical protein